ncbi:arginine deiminase [Fructilactobacillus carniphilus]|uniref:Arginine deiminase n=1 Tax=Fructilactobacillus carniphilus TaxID=2940297 RepID=A0ABY5BWJ2_9LACO|nr:arginine deiminase [Fructilactobacillus carniphilus]USS90860.1 arginine deiminase [Fructilactobacillus carniphilus]
MPNHLQVNSEIGTLREVLVHRPGPELENITPDTMKDLLFDDVPFLKIAQQEHDQFTALLKQHHVKPVYIERLLKEILRNEAVKTGFIQDYLAQFALDPVQIQATAAYLQTLPAAELATTVYAGLRSETVELPEDYHQPFVLPPLPNAYFTRDPQATLGNGFTINPMTFAARKPESFIFSWIVDHHPRFHDTPTWLQPTLPTHLEGGDELVLNQHTLALGISERTTSEAALTLAEHLFNDPASTFETVIAIHIPHNHAMMHLDTVFTMVNRDQFTIFPGIMDQDYQLNIEILRPNGKEGVKIKQAHHLQPVLKEALGLSEIDLIETGGGDAIIAPREQWNDGSNNLAIAPGEVITYDRNYRSIQLMRSHGLTVHEIPSSELARGRGGARCMSQPLWRDEL